MKSEINDLFYSDKYDAYVNSPILEGSIDDHKIIRDRI